MVDLRNLETFVWIARLGGFRAAAKRLHTTQPAISQRIALLERELDVKLFEREPSGVALTSTGRRLLPYAERMLRLRIDLLEAAREKRTMCGMLRLGVSETIVHTWLTALIERMHALYPAVTLEIEVDTSPVMRERLMLHQLDLAFLMHPMAEPGMKSVALSRYPMAWVADRRLDLGPEPVPLRALARWPIITYPQDTEPHQAVRELMSRSGVTGLRMYGNASLNTIVQMTLDKIGVSVIPPLVVRRALAKNRLRVVNAETVLPDLDFAAAWPDKPDSHIAEKTAAVAREVAMAERRRTKASPISAAYTV